MAIGQAVGVSVGEGGDDARGAEVRVSAVGPWAAERGGEAKGGDARRSQHLVQEERRLVVFRSVVMGVWVCLRRRRRR